MLLEPAAEECGGVFAKLAILVGEGCGEMAVDVEFADDFSFDEDGDDDFGFCFQRTREIARIGIDVIDDDGFSAGGGCAANSLMKRDARVRSHGAAEGAEDEHVLGGLVLDHVKADPIVLEKICVEERDDAGHEGFGGSRLCG